VRDKNGFCIPCADGEAGELICKVDNTNPIKKFEGYHGNPEATASKLMHDVFKKGDLYFRTGDLIRKEGFYYYFVDRIGDTFRWKGENVSTTQVSETVSTFAGISECNVYGVEVPGQDGRACMCSVVLDKKARDFDWAAVHAHCAAELPSYAIPRFFRVQTGLAATGTFKHQKVALRKEGCDPTLVKDEIYTSIQQTNTYNKMDLELWTAISRGQVSRL
jgi:fatty-acyl-CoA synthase